MSDLEIKLNRAVPATGTRDRAGHALHFNDLVSLAADAAPDWGGDPAKVYPEQLMATSLSSCHMMTFLALAQKANWPVIADSDTANAVLGKGENGRMTITA